MKASFVHLSLKLAWQAFISGGFDCWQWSILVSNRMKEITNDWSHICAVVFVFYIHGTKLMRGLLSCVLDNFQIWDLWTASELQFGAG